MNAKFNEIIQSNQLVLIDFFADWCGPCKMMSPVLQEVKGILRDDVKILKLMWTNIKIWLANLWLEVFIH